MSDTHDISQLHGTPECGLHDDPDTALGYSLAAVCSTVEPCIHICANNSTIQGLCAILLVDVERYTPSLYAATA